MNVQASPSRSGEYQLNEDNKDSKCFCVPYKCGDFVTYLPHGVVALIDMEDDARNNLEQARQESKH